MACVVMFFFEQSKLDYCVVGLAWRGSCWAEIWVGLELLVCRCMCVSLKDQQDIPTIKKLKKLQLCADDSSH